MEIRRKKNERPLYSLVLECDSRSNFRLPERDWCVLEDTKCDVCVKHFEREL